MAEIAGRIDIWYIRADGISLTPEEHAPRLLCLDLCGDVRIVLDREADDCAGQAAAMRKLARLAAEAAAELEPPAAAIATGPVIRGGAFYA